MLDGNVQFLNVKLLYDFKVYLIESCCPCERKLHVEPWTSLALALLSQCLTIRHKLFLNSLRIVRSILS